MSYYQSDLASIHDDGFGHLAVGGARQLLTALADSALYQGRIYDLGCGSGITARLLADKGYSVIGIDPSEAFVAIARNRVSEATFHVNSFANVNLTHCVAVCAIGEVLNYRFDASNHSAARSDFFKRTFRCLADGGVLLFDVAGPDRAPNGSTQSFVEARDWTVLVETTVQDCEMTRRIVTFCRDGQHYRRNYESHCLRLLPPKQVESELSSIGFDVEALDSYGEQRLPLGLYGFCARKPKAAA